MNNTDQDDRRFDTEGILSQQAASPPFHVMVKPIGSTCNLGCAYCYYLGKDGLLYGNVPSGSSADTQAGKCHRITDELLETFIRQYVQANRHAGEITFAWQGGEPTMLSIDFFRRAVELQRRHVPPGVRLANSIQTNGTLLDDELCGFFRENDFLVGISLDGPADLHDAYRRDRAGRATFARVMAGLELLHKNRVNFNALVVVNRLNAAHPEEVYRFLRDRAGVRFMQFIPCVERIDFQSVAPLTWAGEAAVTDWTVRPEDFGSFLCGVFDEWLARDVGQVFVQTFDTMLGLWMGLGSSLCVFARQCGLAVAMEPDGRVYACDHFVYPEYCIGQLDPARSPAGHADCDPAALAQMVHSPRQQQFGLDKHDRLPDYCQKCEFLFACNGECPKNRFAITPDGQPGLNFLCSGLRRFFRHIDRWMKLMAAEVPAGRPAANAVTSGQATNPALAHKRAVSVDRIGTSLPQMRGQRSVEPNAACPCGSGRKFKKCCGRGTL